MKTPYVATLPSFTVMGPSVRTRNSDEFNPSTAKLKGLWEKFREHPETQQAKEIYGVYSNYESDVNGYYTVTSGLMLLGERAAVQGFEKKVVEAGRYLVFENTGPMPQAIIQAWQQVWGYFQNGPEYQRAYQTDFELYSSQGKVAIYIGVV